MDFFVPCLVLSILGIVTIEFMLVGLLPEMAEAFDVSLETIGRLVSLFALGAAIGGPILTFAVARLPNYLVLTVGLLIFALLTAMIAISPSFEGVALMRFLQGILLPPLVSVGSAAAAVAALPGKGGKAIAQVNFGTVLGSVFAVPAAAGAAHFLGWDGVHIFAALFVLLSAPLIWFTTRRGNAVNVPTFSNQLHLLTQPTFFVHLLATGLVFGGTFTAYSYILPFLGEILGFAPPAIGALLFGFGVAGLLGNWLAGLMVDRGPTRLTLIVASVLGLSILTLSLQISNMVASFVIISVWGGAHIAAFVTCQVRVMKKGASAAAFAGAMNIATANLGIAGGAALGGAVTDLYGLSSIGIAGAILCLLAGLVTLVLLIVERHDAP